jgi:hypothetical protein
MNKILAVSVFSSSITSMLSLHCTGDCLLAQNSLDSPSIHGLMKKLKSHFAHEESEGKIGITSSTGSYACKDGLAGGYPCQGVDLSSFISLSDLGSKGQGNDIWYKLL